MGVTFEYCHFAAGLTLHLVVIPAKAPHVFDKETKVSLSKIDQHNKKHHRWVVFGFSRPWILLCVLRNHPRGGRACF